MGSTSGTSLRTQFDKCLEQATKLGYQVPPDKVLTEVWSGLDRDRPNFSELRRWVSNKEIDCIIFNSVDRLARDPVPLVLLAEDAEKSGVELRCLTEPFENTDTGRLILYILGYASKVEAHRLRERSERGWQQRAKDGKLPTGGGGKKYGYHYIKGRGENRGIRIANEDEAEWVRRMYEWVANEGLSIYAVTMRLRALEVPRPAGDTFWNRSMVHRILTDPAYMGKTYSFTVTREESSRPRKLVKKKRGKPTELLAPLRNG